MEYKLSIVWFLFIKRNKESDTACVLRCLVFKIDVTIAWGNMLLSSFVMIKHVVCCTADTQYTAKFSCDWVDMEHTHDKCCDMLLTLSLCNSQTGTVRNSIHCVSWHKYVCISQTGMDTQQYTLFISTHIYWDDCSNMCHVECCACHVCERRSPLDCMDTSQWRCCKSSYRIAVEKLTWSHMRIGIISIEGSWSTSQSVLFIPLLAKYTPVARLS
jgi:hypothetical protein